MNSTGPALQQKSASRFKKSLPILFAALLTAIFLAHSSLPALGHWLVREDPIHKADAIAVLSGSFPQRALEAADLYRSGYAPEIWLTHPVPRRGHNPFANIPTPSEAARNFELLRFLGIPQDAIHVLDTPIVNTADELNAIDSGLRETGDSSVIIVTSKAHTRRVFSLWDKYHLGDGEALIHAVSDDQFSPSRWWKSRSTRAQGIHEILGMIDLWAGLPVHRPLQQTPSTSAAAILPIQ
jgi:uncharacterized SAM-binding protein YcdF (DUF218 family)